MLGGIAGQGGFDSKGKTPFVARAVTSSTTNINLVSVSGSGYLLSIFSMSSGSSSMAITLVIDGVTIYNGDSSYFGDVGNLSGPFYFSSSLSLQFRTTVSGQQVAGMATYVMN